MRHQVVGDNATQTAPPKQPIPWVAPTNPSNLMAQEAPERGVLGSLWVGLAGQPPPQLGWCAPHPLARATTAAVVSAGYLSGSDILMVQVVAHVPRTPWGHSSGLNRLLAYL